MTQNDFSDFNESCKNVKMIPSNFLDDNRLVMCAVIKKQTVPNKKKKKITIGSYICNPDSNHIDEIHYSCQRCDSNNKIFKVLAIAIKEGWIIDENTKQYISKRNRNGNKKLIEYNYGNIK